MISKFKKGRWSSTSLALAFIIFVALIGLTGCKLSTNKDSSNDTTALSNPAKDTGNTVTPTSTTSQTSKISNSTELYKSKKLGLSITFPSNWNHKYIVKETENGLFVYFNSKEKITDNQGLFFCILKKTKSLNESLYDSINGKKELIVNSTSYFLGGPTDIALPENNPEFKTFIKLKAQIPTIINSIEPIQQETNNPNNTNGAKQAQITIASKDKTKEIFYG